VKKKLLSNAKSAFAASVFALLLSACSAPPAPVDQYQINITQEPSGIPPQPAGTGNQEIGISQSTEDLYRVTGSAGSVPLDTTVHITNTRSGETVVANPNPDGSFVALIHAMAGDRLEFQLFANGTASTITYVYVGALNIKNPYSRGGNWYVGQVHIHTTRSDGTNSPADMEAAYHDAGYNFVISTDHRGTSPYFVQADSGLTPDPDNSATGKDLLWIRGSELGFGQVHMGAWGHTVDAPITTTGIQAQIDAVRQNGGITAINHPMNFEPGYAWEWYTEIKTNKRYSVIETFNGKPRPEENGGAGEVNHLPDAVDLADEYYQIWWIGSDDCHKKDDPQQFNRYAVVVQTDSPSINQADILSSLDSGNHYIRETASGPEVRSVNVNGNAIILTLADIDSHYDVAWKKRGDEVVQRDADIDTTATYVVHGDEGYIRAEIHRLSDNKRAFTQPMFIANSTDLAVSAAVSSGSGAEYLIDNNSSTYWDAGAGAANFIVDVGSVRQVNAIYIDWYNKDPRRFNYRILTSTTGAFTGEQKEVVRGTYDNRSALTLDFFDEVTRYIKVTITGQSVGMGDSVRINEVQVFDSSPATTQLYLDNVQGNDSNTGLYGSPWQSFNYAREHVRPRDVLSFINSGVPYMGPMRLYSMHSGKSDYARIVFKGDPLRLTPIDAGASVDYGVHLMGTSFVDWEFFDIYSSPAANIFPSGVQDVNIKYNIMRNGLARGFLGSGGFLLAYNMFYGNGTDGALIYDNNTNAKIYNNVFYGNGADGLSIGSYSLTASVMNNISSRNTAAALRRGITGTIMDSNNCVNGIYAGAWSKSNNVNADPLFLSPDSGDFILLPQSPCIDAGIDVNISPDFTGSSPYDIPGVPNSGSRGNYTKDYVDIGAFEYVP
jgi:hypothetical protein